MGDAGHEERQRAPSQRDLPKHRPSPDGILKILQSVAILVAAGWTFYLFVRFDENLSRAKVEAEQLRLEEQRINLAVLESKRTAWTQTIEITDMGDPCEPGKRLYSVSLAHSITNNGQAPMEVTYVVVRVYRARLPRLGPEEAIRANAVNEGGALDWAPLLSHGWYYAPKWKENSKHKFKGEKHLFQKGGGGTGELHAGDSTSGGLTVLVRAGPEDLIGFHAIIGFDGGKTADDRWELKQWAHVTGESDDVSQNKQEK